MHQKVQFYVDLENEISEMNVYGEIDLIIPGDFNAKGI
jgi:hypothetical protein